MTVSREDKPLGPDRDMSVSEAARYYAMRLMPYATARHWVARTLALKIGHGKASPASAATATAGLVQNLKQKGWTRLPPLLTPKQVNEAVEYLQGAPMLSLAGRRFSLRDAPSDGNASWTFEAALNCPHVLELANNADVLQIAQQYLGCRPTISGLRIDWSQPSSQPPPDTQKFHRDNDDWKQVKLFIYLLDVDDASGPHEFVATSHLRSGRWRARPYTVEELADKYGKDNFVRIKGAGGTTFMVDTWGVHRGNTPRSRPRILLQIQYSLLPIANFDYRPAIRSPACEADAFTNRLMVRP